MPIISALGAGAVCFRTVDFHELDNNLDYRVTLCLENVKTGTENIAELVEHLSTSLSSGFHPQHCRNWVWQSHTEMGYVFPHIPFQTYTSFFQCPSRFLCMAVDPSSDSRTAKQPKSETFCPWDQLGCEPFPTDITIVCPLEQSFLLRVQSTAETSPVVFCWMFWVRDLMILFITLPVYSSFTYLPTYQHLLSIFHLSFIYLAIYYLSI